MPVHPCLSSTSHHRPAITERTVVHFRQMFDAGDEASILVVPSGALSNIAANHLLDLDLNLSCAANLDQAMLRVRSRKGHWSALIYDADVLGHGSDGEAMLTAFMWASPGLPIIVLTSDRSAAVWEDAACVLYRPFSLQQLEAAVDSVIGG